MNGSLSVLNCGAGDLKITFDKDDPRDVERARRVIGDMLKRGYSLFVQEDGKWVKAVSFDPATDSYQIVADAGDPAHVDHEPDDASSPPAKRGRGRPPLKALPMKKTRAMAVAPTGGG